MSYSAYDILQPQIITGVISTISPPAVALQKIFGWEAFSLADQDSSIFDGAVRTVPETDSMQGNYEDIPTRTAAYDIFDYSRNIGSVSNPMTANSMITPKAVGNVPYTLPRLAETINLPLERIYQDQRPIGGPVATLDSRGERYLKGQIAYQYERVSNLIEFQTASLLRGKFYLYQVGNQLLPSWTASSGTTYPIATVDYGLTDPGNDLDNITGLSGIDADGWDDADTDIPAEIRKISKFLEAQCGQPLELMIMNSTTLSYILNNTAVQSQAGSTFRPFDVYERVNSSNDRRYSLVLRGVPVVDIVVIDYGLNVWDTSAHTFTTLMPDGGVAFLPKPRPEWTTYYRGCEPITLRPYGGQESVVQPFGMYMYPYVKPNPASIDLNCNHNGMPVCFRPKAIVYADVTNPN